MPKQRIASVAGMCLAVLGCSGMAAAGEDLIEVTSVSPTGLTAPVDSAISVTFDRAVETSTVTAASFWAFGRWSGAAEGTISFSNGDQTVTLTPNDPFSAGETVMVILANSIVGAGKEPMRAGGYSFTFWTRAQPATLNFTHVDTMTTRTNQQNGTRSYGGIASDLNNDGYLDITTVNEDSADLRVFMNKADGTGEFDPFLPETFQVGNRASPSEPSDFNRDGNTDICVADINDNTVSVLLGDGDGTYGARQLINVGSAPRGIAVLDVDGDGDTDIVNTNSGGSNNMSILLNDGSGVFGAATFYEGGVSGEWALGAADMNNDGLLDVVVGSRNALRCIVNLNDGLGAFVPQTALTNIGSIWMIALGDVNNDGNCDVSTCNSSSNTGTILLGNGAGGLALGTSVNQNLSFPLATDLGDIDGDGDLDWILSSFQRDWDLFLNNGAGAFAYDQVFNAPSAGSCALMCDINNNGCLDLALIDEIADVVVLQKNEASVSAETICPDDANDFLRTFGGAVTGDALDLCLSDDARLDVVQVARLSPLLPFIRLEYWAHSTLADTPIVQVGYTIESHVSALVGGGQDPDTQRTSIRNYNTGSFELIDQRATSANTDEVINHVQTTNAPDYVNAGDGEIRVRQDAFDPGNVFTPNWFLKVDQYEVEVSK